MYVCMYVCIYMTLVWVWSPPGALSHTYMPWCRRASRAQEATHTTQHTVWGGTDWPTSTPRMPFGRCANACGRPVATIRVTWKQ
jgi:hypothetical protein